MKNLTLKVAVVALAMFAGFGASAQTPWTAIPKSGNYDRGDTTGAAASVMSNITINKYMPFWVYPSVAYNPSYTAPAVAAPSTFTTVLSITANVESTFDWYKSSGLGAMTPRAAADNYVELAFDAIGVKKVAVVEKPAGGIVCDGVAVAYYINVIPEPSATISNTAVATGDFGLSSVFSSVCGDNTTGVNVAVTANLAGTIAAGEDYPFYFDMGYKVYTVAKLNLSGEIPHDGAGKITVGGDVVDITASTSVDVWGADGSTLPSASNPKIIAAAGNPLVPAQLYTGQGGLITVYEFTNNKVNGRISRISDYIDRREATVGYTGTYGFSYYPTAALDERHYIIVLPKPVTGPIYHIANTFAY